MKRQSRSHFWVLSSRFVFRFGSNFGVRASEFEFGFRIGAVGFGVRSPEFLRSTRRLKPALYIEREPPNLKFELRTEPEHEPRRENPEA